MKSLSSRSAIGLVARFLAKVFLLFPGVELGEETTGVEAEGMGTSYVSSNGTAGLDVETARVDDVAVGMDGVVLAGMDGGVPLCVDEAAAESLTLAGETCLAGESVLALAVEA